MFGSRLRNIPFMTWICHQTAMQHCFCWHDADVHNYSSNISMGETKWKSETWSMWCLTYARIVSESSALANQELKLPSPIQFEAWTPPDTGSGAFPSLRKLSYSSSRSKMRRSCRQDAPKMWRLLWPAASMESFSQDTGSEPLTPCTTRRFL